MWALRSTAIPQKLPHVLAENDCGFLREVLKAVSVPVVAEGNVDTPECAARCLTLGAHTVVVGGNHCPQQITTRFIAAIARKAPMRHDILLGISDNIAYSILRGYAVPD